MRGQCNICGWRGEFLRPEGEREGMLCGNCASSSRLRAVIYWLGSVTGRDGMALHAWPPDRTVAILESSARGSYPVMLRDKFDYYATEYDPDAVARGARPREFADFQRLHYPGETFGVVIASDVFEHVRDDRAGYSEIFRTLRPGGTLILTVPYTHAQETTVRRIDTTGEVDVHILEPEYHGGGGHTITYRNYGRDLLTLLKGTGFAVAHARTEVPAYGITSQSVILAQKGECIDIPQWGGPGRALKPLGPLVPFRLYLLLKYNLTGVARILKSLGRS